MFATRRFASLLALALAAVMLTSCADDHAVPSAPPVAPNPSLLGDVIDAGTDLLGNTADDLGLVSCNVKETHRAKAVIGPAGGTLKVGPHYLAIPPKALKNDVLISAVAPKGEYVQIEFEPQGLEFRRSTSLTMSYAECSLLSPLDLKIVYVNDQLEILEVLPTVTSTLTRTATAPVDHFSRYMLAD